MRLSLIVAMDKNRLIGKNNQLPWHLPVDLAHFKKVTMGKPIVMGRKTFESIGRPLPGRQNIVLSRKGFDAEGVTNVGSICEATALTVNEDEVMIIGGGTIYENMIDIVDRMYITYVDGEFEGDAWFPEFDETQWSIIEEESTSADSDNRYGCRFVIYDRKLYPEPNQIVGCEP